MLSAYENKGSCGEDIYYYIFIMVFGHKVAPKELFAIKDVTQITLKFQYNQ